MNPSDLSATIGRVAQTLRPALARVGRSVPAVARWVVLNPALTLALVAIPLRYGLPMVVTGFDEGITGLFWAGGRFVLGPFSLIATWVDPWLRSFPEVVDLVGTAVLGLLPYLAVDAVYRRLIGHGQP